MLKNDLIRLVKTLSANEKRNFKLFCKKQSGERAYLTLFDLIMQTSFQDIENLEEMFTQAHPSVSFSTTGKYLLKLVTESLVSGATQKDPVFQQMQYYMRARILFERQLVEEGLKELEKMRRISRTSQNHLLEYMAYRQELDILSELNFSLGEESSIIKMQMKAKKCLNTLQRVHEHHSLYEILKFRLVHSGRSISLKNEKELDDLVLSELSLVTSKMENNFESLKLHLLFQSYYFSSIGNYKSALESFMELSRLLEEYAGKMGSSPFDYLSALEGILDNLRTMELFAEMPFFLEKTQALIRPDNSGQFNEAALRVLATYRLNLFIVQGEFDKALEYARGLDKKPLEDNGVTDYEKHSELLFYIGLTHFKLRNYRATLKYINAIMMYSKINSDFPIYKAAKLLGMISRYELGDLDYLQYEIRAYKRLSGRKNTILMIEKLIFKAIMLDPHKNNLLKNQQALKKMQPVMEGILKDKYELQVLKFYNFLGWSKEKFGR